MTGVILRGLAARKARALLTAIAVVLGVAMISGTFVLMDTVMSAYSQIFASAYEHTDVVVTAQAPFGAIGASKPALPASLVTRIRALPQVLRAHGYIDAHAQLTTASGVPFGKQSQEASVFGIPAGEVDAMTPLRLVTGHWPSGAEVIVDQATANANHLRTGESIGLVARTPLRRFRIAGIFQFGGSASLGPAQFAAVDLPVAQRIFDKPQMVDEIDVAARPGIPAGTLTAAIRHVLPGTAKVTTATAQAATATADVGAQFSLLRYALLASGAIALFTGSFIIFNTLSITVAQRTRELATLRTLGASRRQVLASILIEGALIGTVASLAGLGAGLGFAKALNAVFASSGVRLPAAGTVVTWRTAAVSIGAGLGVTLAASLAPALRAMRIPPILAIREGSGRSPGRRSHRGLVLTAVTLAAGAGVLTTAATLGSLPVTSRLLLLAAGALVLFAGVATAARWAVAPLAAAIGRPAEPLTRAAGQLARENAVRNPGRTAVTAAALTVGVALIAFVAVLAQGLRDSTATSVNSQVSARYVVTPQQDLLPPEAQQALQGAGLTSASVRAGTVHVAGTNQTMTGVVPADITCFYHFTWTGGSGPDSLTALGSSGALLASDFAGAHHLTAGSALTVQTSSGTTLHLTVRGIYRSQRVAPLLGALTVTTSVFDRSFTTPGDQAVYVNAASRPAVARALRDFTTARIQTLGGFITSQEASIGILLNLFYVLLALCVIISLLGIINTLALSVTERTREIGMLRAVGMTRAQLRRMIRIESQIIALIGAVTGISSGLLLAGLTARALSAWNVGFTIPWATLAILLAAAFLAGTLAAAGPARRAARLDPLAAISYE